MIFNFKSTADAKTLGGKTADEFLKTGDTASNSEKLGGHGAEYFAENDRVKKIQTVSGATLSSVGWYRVAEYLTNGAENISTGSLANSVMLFIKRNRQNNDNEQHLLLLESISGKQSFVSLSSKSNIQIITKARYTYNLEESKVYLEIYYNGTVANFCNFEISHTDRDKVGTSGNRYWWYAITPTLTEETVEGVTVTTTYDIPANASPATSVDLAKYLPLTGGTVGNGDSNFPLGVKGNSYGLTRYLNKNNAELGSLGLYGVDKPSFITADKTKAYDLLHTGNSAKVVISETAPADTSALWVY